jgi:hypothetical protein
MNYNNLFPRLLKNIPHLPPNSFCYDCINNTNYNKNARYNNNNDTRCFIPSGKRLILWFLKHDSNYYSILLEYQSSKIIKCHFKYISFNKILASGNGTMIWVTQIGRELTMNKIIYLKGKHCKLKTIGGQMEELRILLVNYINNLDHSTFIQLKLPVISNTSSVLSFTGNLNYHVYNVVSMANNYNIRVNNFLAVFWLYCIDSMNDCYGLSCKDIHGNLIHYQTALINNAQTSKFAKKILKLKYINYEDIETSDSEDNEEKDQNPEKDIKGVYVSCLYYKNHKRWKPYKRSKTNDLVDDISKIKILEDKSSRF